MNESAKAFMLHELAVQRALVGSLVEKMEARARTQGDIDPRWVATARTDLQKGFMELERAIERAEGF